MGKKLQTSFKIDEDVVKDFDETLNRFKEATGVKPVRQEAAEVALKDYSAKLKLQIEKLKE